ncbi:MAGUK p55 subfamily member 4-like [Brienomyrus brachyistius]|uniref:MAGUK p55 subfamily member 4-like n=1 Tax=Brienomyrus brachyistius TaxID=42636 RepID=UPI0020B4294E|nr:MAGUK p55 subfamily member 4-like [Brienomyrus brachyistius]
MVNNASDAVKPARGLTQILTAVLCEMEPFIRRGLRGADLQPSLLNAPCLQSLLKVYEILQQHTWSSPLPQLLHASTLSQQTMTDLRGLTAPSSDAKELCGLLAGPGLQALLFSHDMVAQKKYAPVLPPVPDDLPTNEEAMRIVRMVKNHQPLGATIRRDEVTGEIFVARVIHGGLASRSGLLNPGDRLMEVNQQPVRGMSPEEIIRILASCQGTVMFKLVPKIDKPGNQQATLFVQAMVDYTPQQDPAIPCAEAGIQFCRGDVLEVVDQTDALWWQARKLPGAPGCAGLIPSIGQLTRKQKETCWSQSLRALSWFSSLNFVDDGEYDHINWDSSTGAPARKRMVLHLLHIRITPLIHNCVYRDSAIRYQLPSSSMLSWTILSYWWGGGGFSRTALHDCISSKYANCCISCVPTDWATPAGFRRSQRLCRRKARGCVHHSRSPFPPRSISSAPTPPYIEVVRYQRHLQDRHRLIALVGPSGVGVNELRRRLIETQPKTFRGPVPHTTRPPKNYEEPGQEYHFISRSQFDGMVDSQRFLEYGHHKGHLYGTSFDAIADVLDRGMVCVVDIDPQAIQLVKTQELWGYVVFVKPPSVVSLRQTRKNAQVLTSYYVNRPFKDEDFQEMVDMGRKMEVQYGHLFDYVLVNDRLLDACMELLSAVRRAQDEPQWVPALWVSSADRP